MCTFVANEDYALAHESNDLDFCFYVCTVRDIQVQKFRDLRICYLVGYNEYILVTGSLDALALGHQPHRILFLPQSQSLLYYNFAASRTPNPKHHQSITLTRPTALTKVHYVQLYRFHEPYNQRRRILFLPRHQNLLHYHFFASRIPKGPVGWPTSSSLQSGPECPYGYQRRAHQS